MERTRSLDVDEVDVVGGRVQDGVEDCKGTENRVSSSAHPRMQGGGRAETQRRE